MPNKALSGMIFGAGVAVGAALAFLLVREKYRRIAQKEIDSVKEAFRSAQPRGHEQPTNPPGYSEPAPDQEGDTPIPSVPAPAPADVVVIPPEEYGEEDDYRLYEWRYFADGVLADDGEEEIARDEYEGIQIAEHFGEYEEDTVYLRDDSRGWYIAILRDLRTYDEVLQLRPPDIRELTQGPDE